MLLPECFCLGMDDFLTNFPESHPIFDPTVPLLDIDVTGIDEDFLVSYVNLIVDLEILFATCDV